MYYHSCFPLVMMLTLGCFRPRIISSFTFVTWIRPFLKSSFVNVPDQPGSTMTRQFDRISHVNVRPLSVYSYRESDNADIVEQMIGGERFELSEIPDSMIDTTIYVGNFCEFVNDNDLCELFRSVSCLQSVPACVIRKPDMTSRRFGFVSFPTVEEKEVCACVFVCVFLLILV